MLLALGFSVLMSAKCITFFTHYADFSTGITALIDEPKPVKSGATSQDPLAPANDDCATATVISSFPYSNVQSDGAAATNNGGFVTACSDGMNDGVWYTVVGDGNNITISISPDEDFDPQLGVYTGSCGAFECEGTIDDGGDGDAETYTIEGSVVGTTYYINIGHYNGSVDNAEGNFTIDVDSVTPPETPANDACSGATAIPSTTYTFEQTDAVAATNNDGFIDACDDSMNDGVWYTVVGDGTNITITVSPSDGVFDSEIGVFTGSCDALECVGTMDDTFEGEDEVYVIENSVIGTTYYINVADYSGSADNPEGNFTLELSSEVPPEAPANDDCANAQVIACGDELTAQSTAGATGGSSLSCLGTIGDDIWYKFTGTGQNIILTATAEDEPAQIEVYESTDGTCDGFAAGDCFAAAGTGDPTTVVSFVAAIGSEYYIHIGSWINDDPATVFDLSVSCEDVPDAVPDCASNPYPADGAVDIPVGDVVFTWEAPTTGGPVDSYDFYGGTTTPLTEDDFIGNFPTTSADITIDGYSLLLYWKVVPRNLAGEAQGCAEWSFTTVAPPEPPVNDACETATNIAAFPFTDTVDATGATNNGGSITSCANVMNDGIWYTVTGDGGDITINATSEGDWDGQLGVYTGSCGTFTCYATIDDGFEGDTETIVITASEVGTVYYINFGQYATADNPEGVATVEVTTTALGVDGNDFKNFTAYPNPVKDILNLSYSQNITNVAVFNLLGQQVIVKEINASQSQVDMSGLAAGTYLVKVLAGDAIKTIKVVKE